MKLRPKFNSIVVLITALVLLGCKRESHPAPEPEPDPVILSRQTMIFYGQGVNSLYRDIWNEVYQMSSIIRPCDGNNILVFMDTKTPTSIASNYEPQNQLFLLNGAGDMLPVDGFEEAFKDKDPSLTKTLGEIMTFCVERYPAEQYGLVMSSHGSGWAPDTKTIGENAYTKSEMEIIDLANDIPVRLEYLFFDACYMNNIEVVYELKDKVNYVIGSVHTTSGEGWQMDQYVPYLLSGSYGALCRKIIESYKAFYGLDRTFTYAAINTKEIEGFAKRIKALFAEKECRIEKYDPESFNEYCYSTTYYIDTKQFIETYFGEVDIDVKIDDLVVGKSSIFTADSLGNKSRGYSGSSLWLPNTKNSNFEKMLNEYKKYKWYQDSGADIYLEKLLKLPRQ